MDNKVKERMVVMPADKQGIYSQQEINEAAISITHSCVVFVYMNSDSAVTIYF